ncbi:hypothetical protein E4U59_006088 [Claviceps monticola]|nr:hypothetical protein E4U59_006088 [Claviceps monticola]
MASIDRYRPPREGYQPPILPGASRSDEPQRCPHPREVLHPASTPPQHSTRASTPRPQGTKSSSQSSSGSQYNRNGSAAAIHQWSFTSKEVESSPSIIDGLSPSEERLRRAKGVNFIYQAGVMLDLPQITLWVAGVFFHRFYMRFSMVQEKGGIHHYNIAATALFLANKVEENCRKTKEIIIAVAKVAQKNAKLIIDEQSKEYWRWRDSILTYEELMLEQLTFDLMVDNPYRNLFELLGQLDIVHNKHLRQAAWAFCNDACLTAIPLLVEARNVAIGAIFFASVHANQRIDDVHGEPWWKYLKGNEELCTKAIEAMRQFYTENPLRKHNPALPSPAFHLENTRGRADTPLSQPHTLSSNDTPLESDGPTLGRSPAPLVNGADPGEANLLKSPTKRKRTDGSLSLDHEMAEKRAKVSEDEGELLED